VAPTKRKLRQGTLRLWVATSDVSVYSGEPDLLDIYLQRQIRFRKGIRREFPRLIVEARVAGLRVDTAMCNHLVLGPERKGSTRVYVAPDPNGCLHDSMTVGWQTPELFAKRVKWREWPEAGSVAGWYLPKAETRLISEGPVFIGPLLPERK
jgi:hypothetical protein